MGKVGVAGSNPADPAIERGLSGVFPHSAKMSDNSRLRHLSIGLRDPKIALV
jgi:hypothetical protein